jgi:phosphoacetylglucosamine mutase
MSFEQWTDMYTDLPSKQLKMPVPNKSLIVCSADEASVEAPADLQLALNAAMQKTPCGRAFVRPSGTEDCVRIYAEAETQDAANKLADEAVLAIRFFVI